MGPGPLAQVLRQLKDVFPLPADPDLLVGLDACDDAAVYRINRHTAVVLTMDFFTPIVDDPYDYGAVAAANSMSDVYAMGGRVALALNICAFPPDLPTEVAAAILRGGVEKVAEAGGVIAGGHTIDDREPKYGLSVMGFVRPDRVLTKSGARPGDALLLTKPLGGGIITTAFKAEAADPADLRAAVESMKRLNRKAAAILQAAGVHACTDVSGFSLLGHAAEMAEKSGVRLVLRAPGLPFLPGARLYAEESLFPCGTDRNREFFENRVDFAGSIPEPMRLLLFSPETSGGLLAAVPAERLRRLTARFAREGEPCWVAGEAREGGGVEVAG